MTQLFANPYDLSKTGFYFTKPDEFIRRAEELGAEEFSIEFIDGDAAQLFTACSINQSNLDVWFDEIECLDDHDQAALYFLCDHIGYPVDAALRKIRDVCLYQGSLLDAATELFDECYAHDIPEHLHSYIDYGRFANDCELSGDMTHFKFGDTCYTVTNASGI